MALKQLVILSGKGGSGKTSVAAALAHLAQQGPAPVQVVLADADVDAANLELILQPTQLEENCFFGGAVAVIDEQPCQGCGTCQEICRFDAVLPPGGDHPSTYQVDPIACDGCAACVYQCPEEAIRMKIQLAGRWFRSDSRCGPLFHAELRPAEENSGKLVTLVKQQARLYGLDYGADLVIVDGPPGIGCPVISAVSGADLALIVAEPTTAGIHDMERVLRLAQHFHLKALVCINKADIYPAGARQIQAYCAANGIEIVGTIPYDSTVLRALVHAQPVTDYLPAAPASLALADLWQRLSAMLLTSPTHETQ